ncbi:single-stranded DNA-binding protein [Microvirga brassicacearum]|uniref:Single-stranded DNA-binding protein n=1 Tax=Microvirga brassicacearum TaxID=2580413 RepID=A0A5N3PH37_9HYPH|nr:single-stranded DNA-binding protein [Microvirga brassicacearum]KAB0269028.1 single-stranded DNA-binding protein [Microvirga brassicacearum]
MAGTLNEVSIIGNLGRDPEVRRLGNGNPVVSFSVACTESWKDKQTGERKEATEWINVVIYNENIARVAEQYLRKGSKAFIRGKFKTRKWEKDGQKHYSSEVVIENFGGTLLLLSGRDENGGGSRDRDDDRGYDRGSSRGGDFGSSSPMERRPAPGFSGGGSRYGDIDDDIPF